jgi:hypothetical protein
MIDGDLQAACADLSASEHTRVASVNVCARDSLGAAVSIPYLAPHIRRCPYARGAQCICSLRVLLVPVHTCGTSVLVSSALAFRDCGWPALGTRVPRGGLRIFQYAVRSGVPAQRKRTIYAAYNVEVGVQRLRGSCRRLRVAA